MSEVKFPETISFYKKTAELQVKLKRPQVNEKGGIEKSGCVFFEMAKAIPNDPEGRIDWQNKMIMKIGINDLANLVYYLEGGGEDCKLFHKNQQGSSSFEMKPGTNGSHGVRLSKKVGDLNSYAQLYLSPQDVTIMREALKASLPTVLGWN